MESTLGARLKGERKRLGYGLEEFAALGGVGKSTQARYEADEGKPPADYLNKISAHGAEIFWIMRGEKEDDEVREKLPPPFPGDAMQLMRDYMSCNDDVKRALRTLAATSKSK
jgi:transcriptional regulator with XRE-family HTH domain